MTDGSANAIEQRDVSDEMDAGMVGETKGERAKMKQYYIGIGLLLAVVVLWTSSSFLTQVRDASVRHVGFVRVMDLNPTGLTW